MSTPETTIETIDTERARQIVAVLLGSRIGHVAAETALLALLADVIPDVLAQRVYAVRDAAREALAALPVEQLVDDGVAYAAARAAADRVLAQGDRNRSCD